MYSNGAVQFGPVPAGNNSFCCQGMQLTPNLSSAYNYSIMPLWTDLIGSTGNNHYSLAATNSMTYGWYNVQQYGTTNTSNFELKITSAGAVDMKWSGALVTMAPVTIGTIGDSSKGEYTQNYYGATGINMPELTQLSTGLSLAAVNPCLINPMYSLSCPGYHEAYTSQQCSISALYDPSCVGYAMAYFIQQCHISPLFSADCPGYAAAFQVKQIADACRANPQPGCSNYVAPTPIATVVSTPTTALAPGIGDPVVSSVVTPPSTTSVTSVTSVLVAPPPLAALNPVASASTASPAPPVVSSAAASETKKTDNAVANVEKKAGSNVGEARKAVAAAAKDAAEKSSNAATLESQAASQGMVVGLMGYVAGFSAYQNAIVPDALAAAVARQYHKPTADNRMAQRGLSSASDSKWKDIVDSQYKNNKVGD